jgi:hypothetical protein
LSAIEEEDEDSEIVPEKDVKTKVKNVSNPADVARSL